MPLTAAEFAAGLTTEAYLARVKNNRDAILKIFEMAKAPDGVKAFFDGLPQPLRLAVFTEDWCGDALTSTPSVLRLAASTGKLEVRVFERDSHLEQTNSFLPAHRAGTLPVFVVFDAELHEVARFIETAKELIPHVSKMSDELRRRLLDPSEADKPLRELTEASRAVFGSARAAYRVAHAVDWGQVVMEAFTNTVKAGLALPPAQRPSEGGTEFPPPQPK
jgi:hypothetical protein